VYGASLSPSWACYVLFQPLPRCGCWVGPVSTTPGVTIIRPWRATRCPDAVLASSHQGVHRSRAAAIAAGLSRTTSRPSAATSPPVAGGLSTAPASFHVRRAGPTSGTTPGSAVRPRVYAEFERHGYPEAAASPRTSTDAAIHPGWWSNLASAMDRPEAASGHGHAWTTLRPGPPPRPELPYLAREFDRCARSTGTPLHTADCIGANAISIYGCKRQAIDGLRAPFVLANPRPGAKCIRRLPSRQTLSLSEQQRADCAAALIFEPTLDGSALSYSALRHKRLIGHALEHSPPANSFTWQDCSIGNPCPG